MNIVLDSNVLVSGLLSPFGSCANIVRMVSSSELRLSLDARIITEYREVLARPKFKFDQNKIGALLDYIEFCGRMTASSPLPQSLPDPDDEPFLEVAVASKAICIVTGNHVHFPPSLCLGVSVYSPTDFLLFYKNSKD